MSAPFGVPELLASAHHFGDFDCGEATLDDWLKRRALANQASGASRSFVVVNPEGLVRGYYAMPMLWREEIIGWANLSVREGRLVAACGYVSGRPPRDRAFARALEAERAAIGAFLGVAG